LPPPTVKKRFFHVFAKWPRFTRCPAFQAIFGANDGGGNAGGGKIGEVPCNDDDLVSFRIIPCGALKAPECRAQYSNEAILEKTKGVAAGGALRRAGGRGQGAVLGFGAQPSCRGPGRQSESLQDPKVPPRVPHNFSSWWSAGWCHIAPSSELLALRHSAVGGVPAVAEYRHLVSALPGHTRHQTPAGGFRTSFAFPDLHPLTRGVWQVSETNRHPTSPAPAVCGGSQASDTICCGEAMRYAVARRCEMLWRGGGAYRLQ
jgi:hypothetical protein